MGIGSAIKNAKDKMNYPNFTVMATAMDVKSSTLNRLKEINNKEDLKTENVEVIEKISNFLGMTINELINFELEVDDSINSTAVEYISSECNDIGILINELITKLKEKEIKIDGFIMNDESKQTLIDSLNISKKLSKNKL
jgi:transcriptional regulator with XRE-family HTH domain